jgi:hypothetical protein
MNLSQILEKVAEGLVFTDLNTEIETIGIRTRKPYLPGVPTMGEENFVAELFKWWNKETSDDNWYDLEVPYPNQSRKKCDALFGGSPLEREWAIEFKRLQFFGDNGKRNDHGVQKMLSPYEKDRSLLHDVLRLQKSGLAKRYAVIGYAFTYSFESCQQALIQHPMASGRIKEIEKVCNLQKEDGGVLDPIRMANYANLLFEAEGLVHPLETQPFSGAWRHPCGGDGLIFGWEIRPKQLFSLPELRPRQETQDSL